MSYNSKYKGEEVEGLLESIGNKVDKVDGKQLSTEDFTTLLKQKLEGLSNYNDAEINEAVQSLQTQLNTLVSGNANDAINSFNEIITFLDGVKDNQDLSSIIASIEQQIAGKMDKVTLSNVATSGSYNDLKDKPNIPSAVTESTVSGWGFTKNKGTVTSVKINGETKTPNASGVVDLGIIEGGSGAYAEVNHGTNDTTFAITPNTFHVWDEMSSLDLSFADEQAGVANEYIFQFTSGATTTSLTLPDTIQWVNGAPNIEANKTYQVSIVNNIGLIVSV